MSISKKDNYLKDAEGNRLETTGEGIYPKMLAGEVELDFDLETTVLARRLLFRNATPEDIHGVLTDWEEIEDKNITLPEEMVNSPEHRRFYLFDLPGMAENENPLVIDQLAQCFGVNEYFDVAAYEMDKGIFDSEVQKINTAYPASGEGASLTELVVANNPNPECVKKIFERGGDIEAPGLMFKAVMNPNAEEIVPLLIEAGVDGTKPGPRDYDGLFDFDPYPDPRNDDGCPIVQAVLMGKGKVFEQLYQAGCKISPNLVHQLLQREETFQFVNELSPDLREKMGYAREGIPTRSVESNATASLEQYSEKVNEQNDQQSVSLEVNSR